MAVNLNHQTAGRMVPFIGWNDIFFRKTAGYNILDHKRNELVTEELKTTPTAEYLQQYKRNWLQH